MKKTLYLLIIGLWLLSGCATEKNIQDFVSVENSEGSKIVQSIKMLNAKRPSSISSDVDIKLIADSRRINATGQLYYMNEPVKLKLRLIDPIMRMLVADLAMDGEILKTYIPIDSTVYESSSHTGDIGRVGFNPLFISTTALGVIPLIPRETEFKLYSDKKGNADSYVVEWENSDYKERIFLEKKVPERVEIIGKKGNSTVRIFYSDPIETEKTFFFGKVKAVSDKDGNSFEITYKKTEFNKTIDEKNFIFSQPKNAKTVKR